jgi:hypothetical protein
MSSSMTRVYIVIGGETYGTRYVVYFQNSIPFVLSSTLFDMGLRNESVILAD